MKGEGTTQYEAKANGQLLAIAQNGNLSNGCMCPDRQFDGSPITGEWAETYSLCLPHLNLPYRGRICLVDLLIVSPHPDYLTVLSFSNHLKTNGARPSHRQYLIYPLFPPRCWGFAMQRRRVDSPVIRGTRSLRYIDDKGNDA